MEAGVKLFEGELNLGHAGLLFVVVGSYGAC